MKQIIITSTDYLKQARNELLKRNGALFNTNILPFEIVFPKSIEASPHQNTLKIHRQIKIEDFPILRDWLKIPSVIHDFIELAYELMLYEISLEKLPLHNSLDQEIKRLLSHCQAFLRIPDFNHSLQYRYLSFGLSHAQIHFLKKHNIPEIDLDISPAQYISGHRANNGRQEIEAIIQDILSNHKEDVELVIPKLNERKAVLASVLTRYGIEYYDVSSLFELSKRQYLSLIDFFTQPNRETLLNLLESSALKVNSSLIDNLHHSPLSYHDFLNQDKNELLLIKAQLYPLPQDFKAALIRAYDVLRHNSKASLSLIKEFLETRLEDYTEADIAFFKEDFSKLKDDRHDCALALSDLASAPSGKVKHRYILDLSVENYPAIPLNKGILDERYRKRIRGYPSREERTDFIKKQRQAWFENCENLYLSFHTTDYEGKTKNPAFEIETIAALDKTWPLQESNQSYRAKAKLESGLAQALFMPQGILRGSVSSLQNYVNDPYRYFLDKGLRLKEPLADTLDAKALGIINHKIMESEELAFSPYRKDLSWQDKMVYARNNDMMTENLALIRQAQQSSSFNPVVKEYRFNDVRIFPDLSLSGIIDRIDGYEDQILIVDYKSSAQTPSLSALKKGTQVQLPSYAFISEKLFDKSVAGIFNFTMTPSNLNRIYMAYSAGKGLRVLDFDPLEAWLDTRKYKGWFFNDVSDLFSSANYMQGLKDKNGQVQLGRKPIDKDKLREELELVYQTLVTMIREGILDPDDFSFKASADEEEEDDTI